MWPLRYCQVSKKYPYPVGRHATHVFITGIPPVKFQDGAGVRGHDHGSELRGQPAVQVRVARALDGSNVGDLTNGAVRRVRVGKVAGVRLAVNHDFCQNAVGSDGG